MLFNQTPFRSADIDDGYTPPQKVADVIHLLGSNYAYGNMDVYRRIDPIIGQYYYGPVDSVLQQVVVHRSQNPGLLPSGTL